MTTLRTARLLAFLAVVSSVPALGAEAESKDPQLVFFFEVDGKRVPLELDKPFATQALSGAKSVTLRLEPHREFAYGGVKFRFPREYSFEADLSSPAFSMWTLSGNDCVLMVHRYRNQPNVQELHASVVDQILKAYKTSNKKSGPIELEVQGTVLKGTRLEVELASTQIVQDVYAIKAGKDVVMLIVQDSPKDKAASAERISTERLLRESLKLPR